MLATTNDVGDQSAVNDIKEGSSSSKEDKNSLKAQLIIDMF